MKPRKLLYFIFCSIVANCLCSCADFVEVETPDFKLDRQTVFTNDASAQNVLDGIYNQLFNANFCNGAAQSVTFLAGLSSDNLTLNNVDQGLREFDLNQVTPNNPSNLSLWSSAYNIIYQANALINNVVENDKLSQEVRERLEGSGRFIRAFTYFQLVNLYGDVPLLLDTDYQLNALAERTEGSRIYQQILEDLQRASLLLDDSYIDDDRSHINKYAVLALLARVNLYMGNWQEAITNSDQVIASPQYELLDSLDSVFLANSKAAIWQISPIGSGNSLTHTREGNIFIKTATTFTPVALTRDFLGVFEDTEDKRRDNWVALFDNERDSTYFPYKYKIAYDASGGEIREYSMVLRLGEQYLIRAEAKLRLNEISGGLEDINAVRSRAGLGPLTSSGLNTDALLNIVLVERRKELFAEWGHRWFDLRRFGLSELLKEQENSNWTPAANLFPIPISEQDSNPNLTQNPGY